MNWDHINKVRAALNASDDTAAWDAFNEFLQHYSAVESALAAWSDKTEWVQQTALPKELGMHRADVLRKRIEGDEALMRLALLALNSSINVPVYGGHPVEEAIAASLRERLEGKEQ